MYKYKINLQIHLQTRQKENAIANQMYGQGADIIFIAGGDVGTGAIEAAKEKNKYAIGVDRDQSDLAPKECFNISYKKSRCWCL